MQRHCSSNIFGVTKSAEAGGEDASTSHKTWRPALFLVLWCLILAPSHSNDFWRQDIWYTIYLCVALLVVTLCYLLILWIWNWFGLHISTARFFRRYRTSLFPFRLWNRSRVSVAVLVVGSSTAAHMHVRWCIPTWHIHIYMIIYIYTHIYIYMYENTHMYNKYVHSCI